MVHTCFKPFLHPFYNMPNKAPNPFNPNSVVSHNLFAGRVSQVTQVLKKIALAREGTPSSFFFRGERGIGKTALARLVRFAATTKDPDFYNLNFATAYYSVERGQTTTDVLQAALNELTEHMSPTILTALGARLGNLLKNGKFTIGAFGGQISVESGASVENKEATIRDQVVSILSNIITAFRADTEAKKDGVLIILDEVNNLADIENCAQLIRGIVTTLNVRDSGYVCFVLIGYHDTEKAFFGGDESARRQFDDVPLGPMPTDEAALVLTKGFESVGVTWDAAALNENIKSSGGYPHSIQMLGHMLYETDKDGHINSDDWATAIAATAFELQTKGFANMYSFTGKKHQREDVLDALAKSADGVTRAELAKQCSEVSNLYRLLPRLKEEGSVTEDEDEKLAISSQLLRVAILISQFQRKAAATQPK